MTSLLLPGLLLLLLLAWPLYNVMLVSCTLTAGKPIRVAARPATDLRYYWIVIPALNEEKVIANTVESALARGVSGDHDRLRALLSWVRGRTIGDVVREIGPLLGV